MSDVFFSVSLPVDLASVTRAVRFMPYTEAVAGEAAGASWAVSRVDDFALWGPAWDARSQTRVLIGGRIGLEELEWAAAERLPYEGGLAARHILARWLEGGASAVAGYNGAAVIVLIDQRRHEAHIWTDRMGCYPAFATTERGFAFCTHPDVIAQVCAAAGRPLSVDAITIADMLRTGAPTHPFTNWREIRQLDAASRYRVGLGDGAMHKAETYWRPAFMEGVAPLSRAAFVEAFADAFRAAGRRRTLARLGRSAVLLSSGADSRGILMAGPTPSEIDCYTYYDAPNTELEGARRIAALAGAPHFPLQREPTYYASNAPDTVRISGGMWSIESGHHVGFAETIRARSPGALLTGCYCDYLFKGVALNRRSQTLFGRNLPLYKLAPYAHHFYLPYAPVDPDLTAEIDARLDARYPAVLRDATDPRLLEHMRLAPLAREGDVAGRMSMWRTMPFDMFVADNDILDVWGRLAIADKISGIAFGQGIARVTGPAIAAVPNNNFGAPVGTTEMGRVATFLIASFRRKLSKLGEWSASGDPKSVATDGSWPNYQRVVLISPQIRAWFDRMAAAKDEMPFAMLPSARKNWTFQDFAERDVVQLLRLVTADLWLQQQAMRANAHLQSSQRSSSPA